ncbi:carboxypeptidase regulatory-like domain-containing protein, partial [Candidatus Bathyarchaeota archaeon]|nr:carboxypeptidase regulatory-like domain-containing protein [Candidatus Bathyarchaeota archaeon]
MSRGLFVGVALILLSSGLLLVSVSGATEPSEPLRLKVFVGPPKIPADNGVYEAVFIQLQDSKGRPARAPEDVVIHLSSSSIHVGSVEPTVTIPKEKSHTVARFQTTYTPGSTMITAAAPGYITGQATMTTTGPVPTKLAVYIAPPVIPADGGVYEAIVVQLQDDGGSPARAPLGDVWVTLSSSNMTVGSCPLLAVIRAGETYVKIPFYSGLAPGSTVITAMASGYSAGQTSVKTEEPGDDPRSLKVFIAPPKVPAEGVSYDSVYIQLQDSKGRPARAPADLRVDLSSSSASVGLVDGSLTIHMGRTSSSARFHSTYRAGSTVITAAASGYTTGQASLTTVGPVPSKLVVYPGLPSIPADGNSSEVIVVQLQDHGGTPAKDPEGDVAVDLFSSVSDVGLITQRVVIPYGGTHTLARFYSTYVPGQTIITAIAPGYTSGQATVTTHLIDLIRLNVTISAEPDIVNSSGRVYLKANVTYEGRSPARGATLKLSSDGGGEFTAVREEGGGIYTVEYTAPKVYQKTICTITAEASKKGYLTGNGTVRVTINPVIQRGSLQIHVTDQAGKPIPGAVVESTNQPQGQQPLKGTTNQEGKVHLEGLIPGPYRLQIHAPGYNPATEEARVP